MSTRGEALARAAAVLQGAGVEGGRRDARLLLAHVLECDPGAVFMRPEAPLAAAEKRRFDDLVARRARREPVSRILGRREFWSLSFALGPATLDPRPDSETLVQAVLDAIPERGRPLALLDLGTGTGCLLLALLSELPAAHGVGVDISAEAVGVARRNAAALGLDGRAAFAVGDWGDALEGPFDVIVANPPYIPDGDIAALEAEVALWDPRRALAGGPDGLVAIRAIAPAAARLLAPGGIVAVEVGEGQDAAAAAVLAATGLTVRARCPDLSGIARCVLAAATPP